MIWKQEKSLEKVRNIRVIIFKMNLKPATIFDNKEYFNYNKADFSAMITFMRSSMTSVECHSHKPFPHPVVHVLPFVQCLSTLPYPRPFQTSLLS